jgi:sugar fermentation stimulation protein A
MKYVNLEKGIFVERLHRFGAMVVIGGREEYVHVKNTGRCREILIPGAEVYLERGSNPNRKTRYSIISALKDGAFFNIDSQVPNTVVFEAIMEGSIPELSELSNISREVTYGNSRFDIGFHDKGGKCGFIEVKGVTLDVDGVAMFPDAPTKRGVKHLKELTRAVGEGYGAFVFFLLQYRPADIFTPNRGTDPGFADALTEAKKGGVGIIAYDSIVTNDSIELGGPVELSAGLG